MKRIFGLVVVVVAVLFGTVQAVETDSMIYYQMEKGRFYNCAPLETGKATRFVAVGQRKKGEKGAKRQGYIAILELKNNTLKLVTDDMFQVTHEGRKWPSRVRNVAVVHPVGSNETDIYITGRGGSDEEGIGFFRHYTWKNNVLAPGQTIILQHKQEGIKYTHGYSLKTGDIDGDGKQEAIYGGFYGRPVDKNTSEDFAHVRVFKKNAKGNIEETSLEAFEHLRIPIRINALEVKDMNGDSKAEIIIAGRSRHIHEEYSSFAIWSDGRLTYHLDMKQALPGRFRTVMAMDIDGDGKDELITGGRVDLGKRMVADLQIWKLKTHGVDLIARYNWTSDASTRLRALALSPDSGQFIAAGRTELLKKEEKPRWNGFIRHFQFKNGSLWPVDLPFLLDKGPETRIRDIKMIAPNRYLSAGFIMFSKKKSAGFVMIN